MINRFKNLSIGQSIFFIVTLIVGVSMLLSSVLITRLVFSRTDSLIAGTSKEINKQVVMNYENYLSNVIDTSNTLQKYILELTKSGDKAQLVDILISTRNIERNIQNIALFDTTGLPIATSSGDPIISSIANLDWFTQAQQNPAIHHFSSSHIEDIIRGGSVEVFSVSKSVQYYENDTIKDGILLIDIDTTNLKTLAAQTNLGTLGQVIITDEKNSLIYSSNSDCTVSDCSSAKIADSIILGGKLVSYNGLSMYVNVNTIKYTRWKIATFINVDSITRSKNDALIRMIMIFIGTLVAITLSSTLFSRRVSIPMNKLKEHIGLIEHGDFDSMIAVEGQKEVVILAEAFNLMSQRIKELMQRVMNEQIEKRKTQFIALQNQINPHFLYNTLDSIVWLSENNRNKDVEKAIVALSKFFRMSISSEMSTVSLKDEVEHVRNYLLIQQIRYQNSFGFRLEIDPKVEQNNVIKLSLQPLVENAIIHGIVPEESFTQILIKAYEKDNATVVEVYNEGYGIDKQRIDEIHRMIHGEQESTSMGLKNVYQRLKLYYGNKSDLFIESELDEYTKVTMIIPITEESAL
jgi:two-component system, sensor histidine kinase YesM